MHPTHNQETCGFKSRPVHQKHRMKIDISESPYYPEFERGYIITHKGEGRRYIVMTRGSHRICTSYARYLMSVAKGRRLDKTEQVDHIDEDKSNDTIENLQILTQKENIAKNKRKIFGKKHGTRAYYRSGCRCSKCVMYMRKIRNRSYSKHKVQTNERRRKSRQEKAGLVEWQTRRI